MKIDNVDNLKFNVSEIFFSIQGESTFAGLPCVFVRLQGCNMRCEWCDTDYSLDVKKIEKLMTVAEIIENIQKYECKYICITGGEPLMQKDTAALLKLLCDEGYQAALETNGHYSLKDIDSRVHKIVDFKCPGSKMQKLNNFDNVHYLGKNDEVKFVIADKADYLWSKKILHEYRLSEKVNSVLFSAVFGSLKTKKLAKWILNDNLPVRLQLQLHKYIWNPQKRGV